MEDIEFTEQQIVDNYNRLANIDGRILPKIGKGGECRTGRCKRCGKKSWPYALCRHHRELGSVKRAVDKLVENGIAERLTDGRGCKKGALYRLKESAKQKPYIRAGRKTGSNELCPCGSGKKYKKCCK